MAGINLTHEASFGSVASDNHQNGLAANEMRRSKGSDRAVDPDA